MQATEELPETIETSPSGTENFVMRQFRTAGLLALADKVRNGLPLDMDDALTLCHVSLPLLAKLIQLRPWGVDDDPALLPVDRIAEMPERATHIGQPLGDWESFCRTLIANREELTTRAESVAWFPALTEPLDRESTANGSFTGAEVLRAIAVARLVLPESVEVRAPLAMLGPKLAQVALSFGASHLGYVAVDGQPSSDPLMAESLVLEELLGDCQPTSVKDNPQPAPIAS